jgi:hypothetical protein
MAYSECFLAINSAQADFSAHTLAISGVNFGSTQPTVTLDAMQLAVTAFSPTAINATLPTGLVPGSYHLVVNASSGPPRLWKRLVFRRRPSSPLVATDMESLAALRIEPHLSAA